MMVVEPRPRSRRNFHGPDVLEAATAVSEKVMLAALEASRTLHVLGIPHAIIGGIAVGAHGAPRATRDVDFLVNQEDAFKGSLVLSFREDVPIAVNGVLVDYLTPEGSEHYVEILRQAIVEAPVSEGIPVVPLEPLVLMKLQAGRRHDLADVARLLDQAHTEDRVRRYIAENAPELIERLDLAMRD